MTLKRLGRVALYVIAAAIVVVVLVLVLDDADSVPPIMGTFFIGQEAR